MDISVNHLERAWTMSYGHPSMYSIMMIHREIGARMILQEPALCPVAQLVRWTRIFHSSTCRGWHRLSSLRMWRGPGMAWADGNPENSSEGGLHIPDLERPAIRYPWLSHKPWFIRFIISLQSIIKSKDVKTARNHRGLCRYFPCLGQRQSLNELRPSWMEAWLCVDSLR
jgi:hypothetical protein